MYDFTGSQSTDADIQAAKNFLCQSVTDARAGSGGGGINILGYVSAGAGGHGESSSSHGQSFCSDNARFSDVRKFIMNYRQTLNRESQRLLSYCIIQDGFHAWIQYPDGGKDFSIKFKNTLSGETALNTRIAVTLRQVTDNYTCNTDPASLRVLVNTMVTVSCTRKNSKQFTIDMNASVRIIGGDHLTVPEEIDLASVKKVQCPFVDGWWLGGENNLTVPIRQDGCLIQTNLSCGENRFLLNGAWNDITNEFDVLATIITPKETCLYPLKWRTKTNNPYDTVKALDSNEHYPVGRCGFPSNHPPELTLHYTRVAGTANTCQELLPDQ